MLKSFRRKEKKDNVKEAKKKIKNVEKIVNSTEKKCCMCQNIFDVKLFPEQLDSWYVELYDDCAKLYCNSCFPLRNNNI